MEDWKTRLLAASGCVPLLFLFSRTPDFVLLNYSVLILAWFQRERIGAWTGSRAVPGWLLFAVTYILSGLFLFEVPAWLTEYVGASPYPALMHSQLLPDLLLAFPFYAGLAAAWILVLRFFRFSLPGLFLAQGVFGVLVEQQGGPPGWVYTVFAYGPVAGIAYLFGGEAVSRDVERRGWVKYPAFLLAAILLVVLLSPLDYLVKRSGLIPQPRPIRERPFW